MNNWVFPTVSEAFMEKEPALDGWLAPGGQSEREWHVAVAAILSMLPSFMSEQHANHRHALDPQGIIMTGPSPLLSDQELFANVHHWTFTPTQGTALQLPPCDPSKVKITPNLAQTIPLLPADPQAAERFCLVQMPSFSWIAVLRRSRDQTAQCQFSFVPETVQQMIAILRSRIQLTRPHQLDLFDTLSHQYPPVVPDYRIIQHFSRQLIRIDRQTSLPSLHQQDSQRPDDAQQTIVPSRPKEKSATPQSLVADSIQQGNDIALLKAIAHEVRTPLTTIQTFTQLLLKRSDLPAEVLKRLEAIRRECHDQIERFSLIFRAMELANAESTATATQQLMSISVQDVLQTNIPRWRKQADRRNLSLTLEVPQYLPAIAISDPTMLEQVLTGLIERLSHSLPMGSQIELYIALAGNQLKLELRSKQNTPATDAETKKRPTTTMPMLKAIGDLLMLQPETGGLSLSLPVTKHLFEILGGKLTVRQHHQQGEVLTIFLPLGTDSTAY